MPSKRLTNAKRDAICDILLIDRRKEVGIYTTTFQNALQRALRTYIPEDVLLIWDKYPGSLEKLEPYIFGQYWEFDLPRFYITKVELGKTEPVRVPYKHLITSHEEYPTLKKIEETLREKSNAVHSLRNQINCVLSTISTYSQLAREFPEAYTALLALDEKSINGDNGCDAIESVRAVLSVPVKTAKGGETCP